MKVLQLIDSLRPGGAEQMAVSYANALARRINGSYLCCTRMEGLLKKKLDSDVGYLFLGKINTLDLRAYLKLRKFVKRNEVDIIQAHGSSFFLAVLIKFSLPGIRIVWHDHWGERALKNLRPGILRPASLYFDGVITVNTKLYRWAKKNLSVKAIRYIPNFLSHNVQEQRNPEVGGGDTFRIICVANLRPPKDHLNLLGAFKILRNKRAKISLHLIGKIDRTPYCQAIIKFLKDNDMADSVYIYGEKNNIAGYLRQADLAVLSSVSEGLPVVLLEYGSAGLPVVCTKVGECSEVIGGTGKLVPSQNVEALAEALAFYIDNEVERKKDAAGFQRQIREKFSEEAVIPEILNFFRIISGK